MRLIDGDALKRKAQKVATESWKMRIRASVETTLNQFIDWIDEAPVANAIPAEITEDGTLVVVVGKNAVINRVITFYSDSIFCNAFYQDGKTDWIPVTPTTMPKNEDEVIVSILDDSGDNTFKYTASGWYATAGDFWVVDNEVNRRVVAWMPLPSPYNENKKGVINDD